MFEQSGLHQALKINTMHLKIPMNNLPEQPPGRMAADKVKERAIFLAGDGYAVKTDSSHHSPAQPQFVTYQ